MYVYNCQASGNPFGFMNKSSSLNHLQNIRRRAVNGLTSHQKFPKCSKQLKKKLTPTNVKFLQHLGLKVKNQ